jgi:hypothetical protein
MPSRPGPQTADGRAGDGQDGQQQKEGVRESAPTIHASTVSASTAASHRGGGDARARPAADRARRVASQAARPS